RQLIVGLVVQNCFPRHRTVFIIVSGHKRGAVGRRLDRLFAALGLHAIPRFFDKSPGNKAPQIVTKFYVELRLNGETVHVEGVGCVEKMATMADRQARGIFSKPAKLDVIVDKLVEVLAEDRLRRAGTWLN